MKRTFLVITSIANQEHPVLNLYAKDSQKHNISFIVIGDSKSPNEFNITGCDFYSLERQISLNFALSKILPSKHYSRKNLGYLVAFSKGAEIIIETDDDNIPLNDFWNDRKRNVNAHFLINKGWVNVYKYYTDSHVWPRGFSLEHILTTLPELEEQRIIECPIQQGLADENPDVDAIYRLTQFLPLIFNKFDNIALGTNTVCPFNSQNTTWFKEAFPLMYLPSYCSFRMTDIWRSFVAQRIAWTCGWPILFHHSTVIQERNDHSLMNDFRDEMVGYNRNLELVDCLKGLDLKPGVENINNNLKYCYEELIRLGFVGENEMLLLDAWINDLEVLST
jgi:hypothetical protein